MQSIDGGAAGPIARGKYRRGDSMFRPIRMGTCVRMASPKRPSGQTRREVAKLAQRGLAGAEIARRLDISKPTVCFHLRGLGIPAATEFAHRYDWGSIRAYYESGSSMTQCMVAFGFSRDAWLDAIRRGVITPRPRLEPIEAVLRSGRRRSRSHVKLRLLEAGLKERCCELCGRAEWRGRPLALELHHVNGETLDNRLENLQLLCPNCHSQTETWGGRNKGRKDEIGPPETA